MARVVHEQVTDDLDGSEEAQTVQIGWQGEWREIDLGEANLNALSEGFDRFWNAARPARRAAGSQRRARSAGPARQSGRDPKVIRAWAVENGIPVPSRGRIPADVEAKYDALGK